MEKAVCMRDQKCHKKKKNTSWEQGAEDSIGKRKRGMEKGH